MYGVNVNGHSVVYDSQLINYCILFNVAVPIEIDIYNMYFNFWGIVFPLFILNQLRLLAIS